MFVRQAQPSARAISFASASNDNGSRRGPLQRPRAGAGGIVGIAAEIVGAIALLYVADGVFRISPADGAPA